MRGLDDPQAPRAQFQAIVDIIVIDREMPAVESPDIQEQAAVGQEAGRRGGADLMGDAQQVAIAGNPRRCAR